MFCGSVLLELIEVIVMADLIYMVMEVIIKNLDTNRRLKVSCPWAASVDYRLN